MTRLHDDVRLAGAYQAGNGMPESSLRAWAGLIASFAPRPAPAVLEIGAGTGMFCAALARWQRAAPVLGVDPSVPMLEQARRHNAHPGVHYVVGSAEAVPTRAQSFDLALLSRVVHHLPDRPSCARELARVLRPGGVAVIRTTFRERLDALVYDYWPRLRAVDEQRFPGREEVLADFTRAGFAVREVTSFAQPVTPGLRAYHERMSTRPQSKFGCLTTEEFENGLRRLAGDAASEPAAAPWPVPERYDLAVLALD
ncbi:methyltransferase domain-containing protein [Kitasatospora sp. NPDC056138]|uniref:class I SAM-dependent methyltransferase n=1 Tax=Kitasatospora sp. NPDC056138 TaxID=3345724 RepID=UPI0035DC08F0